MRYLPKALVLAALVSLQVAAGTALSAGTVAGVYSGRIVPGVYIGDLSAAGLSPGSLRQRVAGVFPADTSRVNLVIDGAGKTWTVPYASLGATPNADALVHSAAARLDSGFSGRILSWLGRPLHLQPGFLYRSDLLAARLADIDRSVAVAPQNAALTLVAGHVTLVPAKDGRRVDIAATTAAVGSLLPLAGGSVPLVWTTAPPAIVDSQLTPLQDLLAVYVTRLEPGQTDRNHNVALAARLLDGTLLPPGTVLSLNGRLGPRSAADGFRPAPAIVNDALVDEDGGGVCQIATTLYNAALLAGLRIEERHPHSLPVPYVPLGLDATVDWNDLDLKVANDTGYPVYLAAGVRGNQLTVEIFGHRSAPEQISVFTKVTTGNGSPIPPQADLVQGPGGPDTVSVAVYRRVVRPDGRTTTELVSEDYYHPVKNQPEKEK